MSSVIYIDEIPENNENTAENDDSSASPVSATSPSSPAAVGVSSGASADQTTSILSSDCGPNVVSDNDSSQEGELHLETPQEVEGGTSASDVIQELPTSSVPAENPSEITPGEDLNTVMNAIFDHMASNPVYNEDDPNDEEDNDATTNNDDDAEEVSSSSSDEYYDSESSDSEESSESSESYEDEDDSVRAFDWQRNTTASNTTCSSLKPYFSSRTFQNNLMDAKFPVLRNDEGAIVTLGDEWDSFLYCGRRLGRTAIPQSDGRCGPNNGPQCESCRRLQTHEKYKILEIIFPSLDRYLLTGALRKRGGNALAACQFLESSCENLPRVPPEVAFPGPRPDGIPEPSYPVSDADARNVVSFFDDNITIQTAKMALRKNEHNLEQAVTYILDKSPDQLAVETSQDVERVKEYEDAVLCFQIKRRESIQEVARKLGASSSDEGVIPLELRKELKALVPEMDLQTVIPSAIEDGHGMIQPSSDASIKCTVCALEIGTKYAGSQYCLQCNLCEGCIQTKVVYKCPRMGNGGHLHCCPLQPMKIGPDRKGYICDINGKGCLHSENHNLSYYCQECNFDVCAVCISQPAPVYYHRRLGRLMQLDDEDDEVYSDSEEVEEEEAISQADPDEETNADAESEDTAVAEDVASTPEPVVVADGEASDASEVTPLPATQNEIEAPSDEGNDAAVGESTLDETETTNEEGNNALGESEEETNANPSEDHTDAAPMFDLHERIAASQWGANAPEEDNQVEIIIGGGDVRTMERRLKRKQSSDDEDAPVMRHNRPETLLTSKYATALENYVCKECPAASNVHHVESLLHLAQGNEKCCPSDAVCQAVSVGKMGIAATCLLAPIFGSKRKNAGEMRCFCGDIIDSKTAPDGAVGCLNGHALHPSCAADYLLSGGDCPTCREPLFFPKVGKAEATAAEEYLEVELQRRRKEEEESIRNEQLANGQVFNVNDIVRISSDVALCKKELMANPGKTGWASEMDSFCGVIGRVTEVEEGKVKIKNKELQHCFFKPATAVTCNNCSGVVGSKDGEPVSNEASTGLCIFCGQCNSCCSKIDPICEKSSIKLNWTPSTVSLIGRASSAALWDKSLVDKDLATAAAAEQHVIRLRAELNAVTTARATVQDALGTMKGAPSIKALDGLKEAVSAFDFERARHLLGLMNHWGDGPVMLKEKKAIMETLRKGDIDTAARKIRHHNAALVEDDAKWRYAASDNHEFVVESWAKIDLLAWPSLSAARTGYCLGPKVRFQSKQEVLDSDGNIWLLVDENSLILPQFVNGKPVVADPKDPYAYKNLVGCQVIPGPNWKNDSIAADEIGTITALSGSSIRVKFPRSDSHSWHYPSADNGPMNLLFANPPAPQGWLCMTPRQVPVIRRGRDALQCSACGDGLIVEETSAHENIRIVKKEEKVKVGQTLLVAATLEPVEVNSVEGDHIHCCFANQDSIHSICVKFRRDDLLHPCSATENTEETVLLDGRERSRQDLFMKHGSISDAKAAWNAAKSLNGNPSETELLTTNYASCVKGHLLHARCFQEALIAGKKCPVAGCNEPLWAPKVRRLQRDGDDCCGGNSEADGEAAVDANVSGMDAVVRARNENEDVDYRMDRELKMCPACFSGPLLNQNCNDMEAHHGQCVHHAFGNDDEDPCYFCADAKAISSALMQLSGDKKVVDVLPRCPTHDCVIMFSGCMVCGHLFNETSWADLPKWDPCAKALLDVDRKKRKAAAALVNEITREAALLDYERDAVHNLWAAKSNEMELPPLPPPAMGFSDTISDSESDSDEESDY